MRTIKKHKLIQHTNELYYFKEAKQLNTCNKSELLQSHAWYRGSLNSISLVSLHPNSPQLGIRTKEESGIRAPGRVTAEKQLQSWIIYNALINDYNLPFDRRIKFITDEFARQTRNTKLVIDLFGFNPETGVFTLIELKSSRALTELTRQLNNAETAIRQEPELYRELLHIFGFEWNSTFPIEKIAVWPASAKKQKMFGPNIREICYTETTGGYAFQELK